jgi:hypothetical protein
VNYAKVLEMNSLFTWHIFLKIAKHKICLVKFGKLLEMSNSNNLANQLGIYLILAKQENLASSSLTNQLGKTHLPMRIYARADRGCHRRFPVGWRVKKIKNREDS